MHLLLYLANAALAMATLPAKPMDPAVMERAKNPAVRLVQDTPCGATKEVPVETRAKAACGSFVYLENLYKKDLYGNFAEPYRLGIKPEFTPAGLEKQCRGYYTAILRYHNVLCSFEEKAAKMSLDLLDLKAQLETSAGVKASDSFATVEKINRDAKLLYSAYAKAERYSYHEVEDHRRWLAKNLYNFENKFMRPAFLDEMTRGRECTKTPLELKVPSIYLMGLSQNTARAVKVSHADFLEIRKDFASHLEQGELRFSGVETKAGARKAGLGTSEEPPLPTTKGPAPAPEKPKPVSETVKDAEGLVSSTAKWAEKLKRISKKHEMLVDAIFIVNASRDAATVVEDLLLYGCKKLPPASIACELGKLLNSDMKARQERERRYKHYSVNHLNSHRGQPITAEATADNFCKVHKETDAEIRKIREDAEKEVLRRLEEEGRK